MNIIHQDFTKTVLGLLFVECRKIFLLYCFSAIFTAFALQKLYNVHLFAHIFHSSQLLSKDSFESRSLPRGASVSCKD